MKRVKRFFNGSVLATTVLLIILVSNMAVITGMFHSYVEKESVRVMEETVDSLKNDLKRTTEMEWGQIEIIRNAIADQEELDTIKIKNILSSFLGGGLTEELFLLLPDNRIVSKNGRYVPNNMGLDFEKESKKERYSCEQVEKFADLEGKLVYQVIPIEGKEAVDGIIYRIIRMDQLIELYGEKYFGGHATLFFLDRELGAAFIENRYRFIENGSEAEKWKLKRGYSLEKTREEFGRGGNGMMIFTVEKTEENIYFYYEPLDIRQWMIALEVPETAVFAHNKEVHVKLVIIAAVETAAVIIYFLWMLWYKKKENIEREAELNQVNYMFQIQKSLFDVHQKPERMQEALEEIGKKLHAEMAFFIVTEREEIGGSYAWYRPGVTPLNYPLNFSDIEKDMGRKESSLIYNLEELKSVMPATYEKMKILGIRNIMVTQVKGDDGAVLGILGAWNMDYRWPDARYLECVAMPFFLAYKNIKNQEIIGKMAAVDTLTGLLNRNSYELALKRYNESTELPGACIYADVNGLHEMNNSQGHAEGDEMLRFVAATFRRSFGKEYTYRIGGDEFLIFVPKVLIGEIEERIKEVFEKVESRSYHIAVGLEYGADFSGIDSMVSTAEQKMYKAKKEYYQKNKIQERKA